MKTTLLLNIAASIAALTVVLVAFILIPEPLWTATTIATAIGFATLVGFVFYTPSILRQKQQSTDAMQMAAIGSYGVVSILLLIATGSGFILALAGHQKPGLAMLVFGIGAFLVMFLMVNTALKVVGDVSKKWSQPSHHVDWQNQVTILISQTTHQESLTKLHMLLEKLRYSASDVPGGTPQDVNVDQTLNVMSENLQSDSATDLTSYFGPINSLLIQRDIFLRTARSKS